MTMNKTHILAALLAFTSVISGCAGVAIGGAATGVAISQDRRSTGTIINDQEIEWQLSQAIYADTDINANAHINITVYNGRALLSGEAPIEDLKIRANAIASKTKNIKQVFNEITIESPSSIISRSKDSYITGKIKVAMLDTPEERYLTHIKVVTENGVAFLMGLATNAEADLATEKARNVSGVRKVIKLFEYIDEPPK